MTLGAGSLTENISSIVTGEGEAHGKLTYILAGITMGLLLLTAGWATLIIRWPAFAALSFAPQWPFSSHLRG